MDGASRWQAMLYIVIPVAVPGILSAGIFAFTLSSERVRLCTCLPVFARAEPCRFEVIGTIRGDVSSRFR